jgi:hypothetical protein
MVAMLVAMFWSLGHANAAPPPSPETQSRCREALEVVRTVLLSRALMSNVLIPFSVSGVPVAVVPPGRRDSIHVLADRDAADLHVRGVDVRGSKAQVIIEWMEPDITMDVALTKRKGRWHITKFMMWQR